MWRSLACSSRARPGSAMISDWASRRASSRRAWSRNRSAIRSGGRPCCFVPKSVARPAKLEIDLGQLEAVGRGHKGLQPLARDSSRLRIAEHAAEARDSLPRLIRPRSWCNWARPKRWPPSMVISVALGTSTPTSMTDVHTSAWISPQRKRSMTASFSAGVMRPWIRPRRKASSSPLARVS